jgi:SPP1 family predicted phage head-tail adaptor
VKAGTLRHTLKIEKQVRTSDMQAGAVVSWQEVGTTWASIEPISASERYEYGAVFPTASHTVECRYRNDILADRRFVFGERVFAIRGVINEGERNIKLRVFCEELSQAS